MKAIIFAAGKGTRLGKITQDIPKALVDINGKTALRIAVEKCSEFGFNDVIINVHHFPDKVEEEIRKLQKIGYRLSVSDERDKLLETGGGLFKARGFFDKEPFLVYNVDIITDLDLSALYNYHLEKNGIATLAVRHRKGNRFFLVDDSGIVRGWRNIATGEEILTSSFSVNLSEIAFSGIHIIDPEIFKYMKEGIYSMTTLYLDIASRHNINTYLDDSGYWGDIGTPENLEYCRKISQLPKSSGKQS
jgi:NDP-sugar pyrophosphorylase family protein